VFLCVIRDSESYRELKAEIFGAYPLLEVLIISPLFHLKAPSSLGVRNSSLRGVDYLVKSEKTLTEWSAISRKKEPFHAGGSELRLCSFCDSRRFEFTFFRKEKQIREFSSLSYGSPSSPGRVGWVFPFFVMFLPR
jgi:hypothetical protein